MSFRRHRLSIDAVLFACYDVLIDATHAYREVVRETTQLYLEHGLGLTPSSEPLLTAAEVTLLQKAGNFCSYWDLARALIIYFVELLPPSRAPTFPSQLHVPALLAYLQLACNDLQLGLDALRAQRDIAQLAHDIASAGGGLAGAHKVLPRRNRHLFIASGEITKTNLAGRIFQELYLGTNLFEQTYGAPAVITKGPGYARQESCLIAPEVLDRLSQKMALGVVSDRPRQEVLRSLEACQLRRYFQTIVSGDEIKAAKAVAVPSAWPLLEAARNLQPLPKHCAYVGANLGDIQAAKLASQTVPFAAIGCLAGAHDPAELRRAFEQQRADIILGHPNHLKELFFG